MMGDADGSTEARKVILFDASKRETHHPGHGFKKLSRRLKSCYKLQINKDELSEEALQGVSLVIFGSPRERFLQEEFKAIKDFLNGGGSAALLLGEGGEERLGTNVNYLLEEYGMTLHKDSVVRATYHKYMHPKEALISHGILHPDIARMKDAASLSRRGGGTSRTARKASGTGASDNRRKSNVADAISPSGDDAALSSGACGGLTFVYPYGATMTVQSPAHPVLSSGPISYPLNRPVAGVWERPSDTSPGGDPGRSGGRSGGRGARGVGRDGREARPEDHEEETAPSSESLSPKGPGRLLVVGSSEVFADSWLDKEENAKLCDVFMRWLLGEAGVQLLRRREYEISESRLIPNTESLADRLRCCLQESESLPKNFTKLFNDSLFGFDMKMVPEAVETYSLLGVKHEPLTLIPPEFGCPLPQLSAAVFPPILRDPPQPALDRFDLDEHFASDEIRLAQITNKCSASDLDYYIRECGEIVGVAAEIAEDSLASTGPMAILDHVFKRLIRFKMLNQEGPTDNILGGNTSGGTGVRPLSSRAGARNSPGVSTESDTKVSRHSSPSEGVGASRGTLQRWDSIGSGNVLDGGTTMSYAGPSGAAGEDAKRSVSNDGSEQRASSGGSSSDVRVAERGKGGDWEDKRVDGGPRGGLSSSGKGQHAEAKGEEFMIEGKSEVLKFG